jgi:O-Antigen ligase
MTAGAGLAERLGRARDSAPVRRVPWWTLLALVLAVGVGILLVAAPATTLAAVAAGSILVIMAALGRRSAAVFAGALGILLIGYAFLGRGVAYVGTGSVYVGEAVLFLGLVAFILNLDRARFGIVHWLIVGFMLIGLVRTIPDIGRYGPLALRDAVVWGYAAFALFIATVFERRWFDRLIDSYRWVVPAFLLWLPIATILTQQFGDSLPGWPGAPVGFVVVKQGDFAVQLAGVAAFLLVGLYAARRGWMPSSLVWVLLFADLAIVAAVSRGGMLAAVLGAGSALLFVRSGQRVATAMGIALAGFIVLSVVNPSLNVGSQQGRTLSFTQLFENATSVLSSSDAGNLQGTKQWRLAWWDKIIGYTVEGPYFWTGKGFGINLADADGFQVLADHSLRAPHNGHIALLARGGVPLFTGWVLIQLAFAVGLARAAYRARSAGSFRLVQLIGVDFAIWVAALINMTFDVYLEGPQGGIWFWSVVGFGLVLMRAASTLGGGDPVDASAAAVVAKPTGAPAGPASRPPFSPEPAPMPGSGAAGGA